MNKMEQKPYKGYIVILRVIILPFLDKPIRLLEFGVFIAIVIECDWDKKHSTYGCLVKSNAELASRWGCDSSTVLRHKKRLIDTGLLIERNGLLKIKNFELFEVGLAKQLAKIPLATPQDLFANLQSIVANPHESIANMQDNQAQNTPQSSNVSFKGNLSLSNNETGLSQEDIDLINESLKEEK